MVIMYCYSVMKSFVIYMFSWSNSVSNRPVRNLVALHLDTLRGNLNRRQAYHIILKQFFFLHLIDQLIVEKPRKDSLLMFAYDLPFIFMGIIQFQSSWSISIDKLDQSLFLKSPLIYKKK